MNFKTLVCSLGIIGLLAGCGNSEEPKKEAEATASQSTAKVVTLKFANQHPSDSIASQADRRICEEVEKATNGRVKIELYTDSSLGDYISIFEEVMVGSIDMAHTTPVETYNTKMSASMLPYLGASYAELEKAYAPSNYLHQEIKKISGELGLQFFGFFSEGFNGIGTNKELTDPATPGTDKGVVVRTPGATIYSEGTKALGFRTSSIAYADTYTAIQTGVVNGWNGGPANLNYLYFRDVITHFYNYHYNQEATLIYMNKKVFDSLLPEDQKAITEIIEKECKNSIASASQDDDKYMKLLQEQGIKVVDFTDEERAAMASYIRENVWPKYEESMSKEFIDNIKNSLK